MKSGIVVASVLAAGASRRLGQPKQLVLFRGEPLVARAVRAAHPPEITAVSVVVGAHAEGVRAVLSPAVVQLRNDAWPEGIASSIRCAVAWAEAWAASALAILVTDQPLIDATHVARLVTQWREGAIAAASAYANIVGVPAVFDAALFPHLRGLRGDAGAGRILRSRDDVVPVQWEEGAFDVDLPAQLPE